MSISEPPKTVITILSGIRSGLVKQECIIPEGSYAVVQVFLIHEDPAAQI